MHVKLMIIKALRMSEIIPKACVEKRIILHIHFKIGQLKEMP